MSADNNQSVIMDPLLLGEFRPGYWIGNLQSIKELSKISDDTEWTVISILKSEKLFAFARAAVEELPFPSTVHLEWELQDESQAEFISPRLIEVLDAMDKAVEVTPPSTNGSRTSKSKKACLVHCAFGISRSAAVCAAWLMARQNVRSLSQALTEIRAARPGASPNLGFIASLRALQESKGNVQAAMERIRPKQYEHTES